jgi:hypothetical protein
MSSRSQPIFARDGPREREDWAMHFVSDRTLMRTGYTYQAAPGGFVGHPSNMQPHVNWKHIDGPLLYLTNGGLHWLTIRERIGCFFGLTTIEHINARLVGK